MMVQIDQAKCAGCGVCLDACLNGAIYLVDRFGARNASPSARPGATGRSCAGLLGARSGSAPGGCAGGSV